MNPLINTLKTKEFLLGGSLGLNGVLLVALIQEKRNHSKLFQITKYLAKIIERNDIEPDDFDVIALREMGIMIEDEPE